MFIMNAFFLMCPFGKLKKCNSPVHCPVQSLKWSLMSLSINVGELKRRLKRDAPAKTAALLAHLTEHWAH